MKLLNLAISTALIFNQALGFAEFKDGNNDLPIDGNTDSPDPDSSKQCYNPYGDNGMCNEWASYDECNKNPGLMRTGCAEACGSCEDPCAHRLPTLGIWQEQVTQTFNAVYPEVFYNSSMYFTMEAIAPAYGEGWWEMDEYSQTNAARDYYLGAVGITPEVAATMSAEDLDIAVEQAIVSLID